MGLTRKQTLLKLIVEDFIKTAEPVGSNYLIQKYNLNISSATIRNEMNALEKEGLLEKTHTSSGRVPSNEGYKYYIENLRNSQIDENVKNEINTIFSKTASVDEVLKESCEILSHMTNLASVVLGPSADEERLVSIQLVPINSFTVTAIFVTDKGYVENKTFKYAVIPIETSLLPSNIHFYFDANENDAVYTNDVIPPQFIDFDKVEEIDIRDLR